MKIKAANLLNETEQEWLVERIRQAETATSGEIRVHLEDSTLKDPYDRAAEVFAALEMHETRYRNGVLIYIEVIHQNFVVVGDMAFHSKVNDAFWNRLSAILTKNFQRKNYFEGLAYVIKIIGQKLQKHFPVGDDENPNELPDSISFG